MKFHNDAANDGFYIKNCTGGGGGGSLCYLWQEGTTKNNILE
jgi:hypothetical protein